MRRYLATSTATVRPWHPLVFGLSHMRNRANAPPHSIDGWCVGPALRSSSQPQRPPCLSPLPTAAAPRVVAGKKTFVANHRRQNLITKLPISSANLETIPAHWALHGNAFDPDAEQIAQCKELSKSGDGPHWRRGNSHEIGRPAQCLGKLDPTITGTNTFFSSITKRSQKDEK
jgi:hypothetical protein